MSKTRRIIVISIPNRDPAPIGSAVSSSTRDMRGLKLGSWRFVGDIVEHLLDRAPDHDLALDQRCVHALSRRHALSLASGRLDASGNASDLAAAAEKRPPAPRRRRTLAGASALDATECLNARDRQHTVGWGIEISLRPPKCSSLRWQLLRRCP
jgi:hypothetical protein